MSPVSTLVMRSKKTKTVFSHLRFREFHSAVTPVYPILGEEWSLNHYKQYNLKNTVKGKSQ